MKSHFKGLLTYNNWANQRILICLQQAEIADDKVLQLYSHIITAEIIWLLRIKGLPTSPFPIWEQYKLSELETMTNESAENWSNYLEGHQMQTFEEMIHYADSKGKHHESTIREIISHVLNHSTHHRGQIVMKIRELGIDPPVTDLIEFQRL